MSREKNETLENVQVEEREERKCAGRRMKLLKMCNEKNENVPGEE